MENQQHNPPKTSKVWNAMQYLENRLNHLNSVLNIILEETKHDEVDEAKFEDDEFTNRFNHLVGLYAYDMKDEKVVKVNHILHGWQPTDVKDDIWVFEHQTKGKKEIKAEDQNDATYKLREELKRGSSIQVVKS